MSQVFQFNKDHIGVAIQWQIDIMAELSEQVDDLPPQSIDRLSVVLGVLRQCYEIAPTKDKEVIVIPKELYSDIILCLQETLEQPFECTCDAYQERDTGAWVHNEDKCWAFMEDHIEITLRKLEELHERDADR